VNGQKDRGQQEWTNMLLCASYSSYTRNCTIGGGSIGLRSIESVSQMIRPWIFGSTGLTFLFAFHDDLCPFGLLPYAQCKVLTEIR